VGKLSYIVITSCEKNIQHRDTTLNDLSMKSLLIRKYTLASLHQGKPSETRDNFK
jgi:hypothetical protein